MKIDEFLDRHVSCILEREPFKNWNVEKSIEDDLEEPIIQYVFKGHALALRCDFNDTISVIFLRADLHNVLDGDLCEIPFFWNREQVLSRFGIPSKSGEKISDPILGHYGAWDRFLLPKYAMHVEYKTDRDEIKRITFMRIDAVPK